MQKITPFLWYAKEAEEAATFYASVFPDSRVTRVVTMPSESPSGPPGSVKIVDFVLFGQSFTARTGSSWPRRVSTARARRVAGTDSHDPTPPATTGPRGYVTDFRASTSGS